MLGIARAAFPERRAASVRLAHRLHGGLIAEGAKSLGGARTGAVGGGRGLGGDYFASSGLGGREMAARIGGGGGHLFARYATTERLDLLRTAAAFSTSQLWLQATCLQRAAADSVSSTAGSVVAGRSQSSKGSAARRPAAGTPDDEGCEGEEDEDSGENDPVKDGFGWLIRTCELGLVGGTRAPPAGCAASLAFDVLGALALAAARHDLGSVGRGSGPDQSAALDSVTQARLEAANARDAAAAKRSGGPALPKKASSSVPTRGPRFNSGHGSARLSSAELERCLDIVFLGGDDRDTESGDEDAGESLSPGHVRNLRLWLSLHRTARRRQIAAAAVFFHAYGGKHAASLAAASAAAGAAAPSEMSSSMRLAFGTAAGLAKRINRQVTDLVTERLSDCDPGVRSDAAALAGLLFAHYKPESHEKVTNSIRNRLSPRH